MTVLVCQSLLTFITQILESFVNPRINIDPNLWGLPETFGPCSPADAQSTVDSLRNRNLARITTLIRDPTTHAIEIEMTYQRVLEDTTRMANILAQIPVVAAADGRLTTPLPVTSRRLHVRYQTGYGILLLIAIMLNRILRFYGSPNILQSLKDESVRLVDSIILLTEQASQYRPLGSSASSVFLLAAYAALDEGEDEKARRIEKLVEEYQSDFGLTRSVALGNNMRARLRSLRPDLSCASSPSQAVDRPRLDDLDLLRQTVQGQVDLCCIL